MLVYRVEHGTRPNEDVPDVNLGPYCGGTDGVRKMCNDHNYGPRSTEYPGIRRDIPDWELHDDAFHFVCGFDSSEKLYAWFGDWAALLNENGFMATTYEVPSDRILFSESGKQLAFDSRHAKRVSRQPLEEKNEGSLLGSGDN